MIINEIKRDVRYIKNHTLQPKWFKITKVFLLVGILFAFLIILGLMKTIIWFLIFLVLGLIVHFVYRIKTHGFTKSWLDFKVREINGKLIYERIGFIYYSFVIIIFFISTIAVLFIDSCF